MSISLYDVLDVSPDATSQEIRTAWRTAVAELDPTDRRFAVYNEAGRVLLDPEQRAAYDAERAAAEAELAEPSEPSEPTGPAASGPAATPVAPAATATAAPSTRNYSSALTRRERRAAKQSAKKLDKEARSGGTVPSASARRPRRAFPVWALAALAVVLVGLVARSVYLAVEVPSDDAVDEATGQAQSSAERAIVPVLSYDFRSLDADDKEARSWLTDDYAEKYDKLFAQIKESAPQTKTVVRTKVVASGLVRSGEDRVQVLLFVDRPTRNKQLADPVVYKDQVRVTMEKVGDRWLIDQLCTTASCES